MTAGRTRHATDDAALADLVQPERTRLRIASMLTAAANLMWVGQAYLLGDAVGALGDMDSDRLLGLAAGFGGFVALKVACDGVAA